MADRISIIFGHDVHPEEPFHAARKHAANLVSAQTIIKAKRAQLKALFTFISFWIQRQRRGAVGRSLFTI